MPQYQLRQVTRDTGYSGDPALSPDGKLLAYSSDRDGDGVLDIWVRQLPGGQPTRLTDHQADDFAPSFSTDGTQIVFVSDRDGGGIYVVPLLGSSARRITDRGSRISNPRFSPGGEWIAHSVEGGVSSPTTGLFSRIELVATSGGATRTVETDLAFAAQPVWSPDGKYLLVQGTREPALWNREANDWWVVPVEGGEARELRISSLFEAMAFRSRTDPSSKPRPSVWLADDGRVLFSAAMGVAGENIWQVRLAPGTFEVIGGLHRLTSGVGETMPSAAANGLFAFVSATHDSDIWTVPLDANRAEILGEPERVLEASSDEHFPSISDDGRKLTYVSDRNGNRDIWLFDLDSNENEPLTMGPRGERRGAISPDGKRIAFVRREGANNESTNLYVKDLPQGKETLLVENIGNMLGWMPNGQRVLYYTGLPMRWWSVDAATSQQTPFDIRHPDSPAHTLRFSPDESWVAFNRVAGEGMWLIYIAAVKEGKPVEHDEWIRITEDSFAGYPWWAPDGNTLYFWSDRDGFNCIWAQPLRPTDKQPEGSLKAIVHFHGRLRPLKQGKAAMSDDRLYIPLGQAKANIWLAEPRIAP